MTAPKSAPEIAAPPAGLYVVGGHAAPVPTFSSIRAAALAQYAHDGFLAVSQAYSAADTRAALDGLNALVLNPAPQGYAIQFEGGREAGSTLQGEARLDSVRKLMGFAEADARLRAMAYQPALLDVVERLLGEAPVMIQDMALLKPPRGGREKPWHQDKAYFDYPVATPVVGVWIALDAATVENGCMHVFAGSHRMGPAPHFMIRDWQLCDADVVGLRCVAAPLPPGGALLFDGLLQHGTPPNQSLSRRRALQFHYVGAGAQKIPTEERLRLFGNEGRNASC